MMWNGLKFSGSLITELLLSNMAMSLDFLVSVGKRLVLTYQKTWWLDSLGPLQFSMPGHQKPRLVYVLLPLTAHP